MDHFYKEYENYSICEYINRHRHLLNEHLENKNLTYKEHLYQSVNYGKCFFIASIKAVIHAVLPCYYQTTTTDLVNELRNDLEKKNN